MADTQGRSLVPLASRPFRPPYALAGGLEVSIYTTLRATDDIDLLMDRAELARVGG